MNPACSLLLLGVLGADRLNGPEGAANQALRDAWLSSGRHADMAWLERNAPKSLQPALVHPGCRSLAVLGLPWPLERPEGSNSGLQVASYAWGPDYHTVARRRGRGIISFLEKDLGSGSFRFLVDADPLSERSFAAAAGTGFIGRNGMFTIPGLGSRLFLAVLLSDRDPDVLEAALDRSGVCERVPETPFKACPDGCRACIDACPTGALGDAVGGIDCRLCLSYHSIENTQAVPEELRQAWGGRLFGCEECVDVCPFNAHMPRFGCAPEVIIGLNEAGFRQLSEGTAIKRVGYPGFVANACAAVANLGRHDLLEALDARSGDANPTIAAAARWAAGRLRASRPS